jgi:threonine/homoserine efflux transporter RhtA
MATKYGQDAINALAERMAKFDARTKTIVVVVLLGVAGMGLYHWNETGDTTPLAGLGILFAVAGFFAFKISKAKKAAAARRPPL